MILGYLFILIVLFFFFYASYSIRANVYMYVFCRKQTTEKIVAITFDDGPDSIQTPKVLRILKENNTPACFFCIGSKIKGNEQLIRQITAEGHSIGIHSYSHAWNFPLYPLKRMEADLLACQTGLEEVSKQPVRWFRPPFGVTNPTIAKAARDLGYFTIGWNIRTMDTQNRTSAKVLQRIRRRLFPGSIILLHDRLSYSDSLLTDVLALIEQEGYAIVPLKELIKPN